MDIMWNNNFTLLLLGGSLALISLQLFRTWWRLRKIPGPLLASLTNLQRVNWVRTKRAHLIHQEMHEKYGDVIRIGPNTVIFNNPEAIPTVYVTKPGFIKGDFYAALTPFSRATGSVTAIFNSRNEATHKMMKSPIAPMYSNSSAATFEPHMDEVMQCFSENLEKRFAKHGNVFDLGSWLQYFAFDVMGTMTFSKKYGFLDQGKDVGNMIGAISGFMKVVAPMTQIPWLDMIIHKNSIADSIRRAPGLGILKYVAAVITERREQRASGAEIHGTEKLGGKKDFLTSFLDIQKNTDLPDWTVSGWTFSNVTAGSDSVGTTMQTIMFNLLSKPHTLSKLANELQSANISRPYPKFKEVDTLPYLDACMWEAIRMHPPFNLPLERTVPEGGITISGHYIPAGTNVGGCPYVVNRHKPTFGEDAEFWRPERWLEGDEKHKVKLERSVLTFGAGKRICLGKQIGIMEIKKCIAFLILTYNIHIVDPKAFKVENNWFFGQKGLNAWIENREESGTNTPISLL